MFSSSFQNRTIFPAALFEQFQKHLSNEIALHENKDLSHKLHDNLIYLHDFSFLWQFQQSDIIYFSKLETFLTELNTATYIFGLVPHKNKIDLYYYLYE